jgi:fructokinase
MDMGWRLFGRTRGPENVSNVWGQRGHVKTLAAAFSRLYTHDMALFGGIEAGGTKFICGIGTCPDDLEVHAFPTVGPVENVRQAVQFFQDKADSQLAGLGIASFGPIDLDRTSATYGYITTTPKTAWRNIDLVGALSKGLSLPIAFETDVNAAALAEAEWGASRDVEDSVYITVGTGIGGGVVVNGEAVHGLLHPEIGHIRVAHDLDNDPFTGSCQFHGDCLEGLASAPALSQRWGRPPESLPATHPAWELEARYLASVIAILVYTLSPHRIILGGGVMQHDALFPMIRRNVGHFMNGYIAKPQLREEIDRYIVPPGLGRHSGVLGAILLASRCYQRPSTQD